MSYIWTIETPQDVKERSTADKAAEAQFYKNKYMKILNMKYELRTLGKQMEMMKDCEDKLKAQMKEKTAKEHNNSHMFITVNPKPGNWLGLAMPDRGTLVEAFIKKIIKFINRNFCEEAWAVIEQRGVEADHNMGHGYHAHIALKRDLNYRPSDIIKGAKNTFKNCCDTKNPACLNVKIHGADFHKDKMEYIQGIKTGEGKDEKQKMDKLFREKYNIEVVYNAQKNQLNETT
ncbi:MAG: putative replication initiation protein [Circular genetic element sp.]|nr:MAG: putative replication initiation protein [Circular genetic element sp.]